MSDISQGPGWWQASDGKWYPPELAPGAAQPPTPQQPPVAPPPVPPQGQVPQQGQAFPQTTPGAWQQPQQPQQPGLQQPGAQQYQAAPPEKEGMSGCLKAFIIFFVLCAVLVVGVGACTVLIADDVKEAVDDVKEEIDDAVAEAERIAEEAEEAASELEEVGEPDGDTLGGTTGEEPAPAPEPATTTPPEPVPATTAPTTPADGQATVVLAPGGLAIVDAAGASTRLNFGTDQQLVIDALSAALGEAPALSDGSAECPNGQAVVASWPDLRMDFDESGSFLSWTASQESTLTDENGIGLGSTRTELDQAFAPAVDEDSTLGTEFYGETTLSGLLSGPDADDTIDALWAGSVCVFR